MAGWKVAGLTGGIGVGKTAAAEILADFGAIIVDCDQLGRDVAAVNGRAFGAMVDHFGPRILDDDGAIDRAALAAIVFNDADALQALNGITHPAIDAEIALRLQQAPADSRIVLDMAVLVETQLGADHYEEVLVIEAPIELRQERLLGQRGMNPDDANARMASQASDEERRAVADYVVVNDSGLDELRAKLLVWWQL